MIGTAIEMLVGIGGTTAYLYLWNLALAKNSTAGIQPTAPTYRAKLGRRRIIQILFFLGMTPYILILFAAIDRLQATFGFQG